VAVVTLLSVPSTPHPLLKKHLPVLQPFQRLASPCPQAIIFPPNTCMTMNGTAGRVASSSGCLPSEYGKEDFPTDEILYRLRGSSIPFSLPASRFPPSPPRSSRPLPTKKMSADSNVAARGHQGRRRKK